jgi:hypothetical protein
LTTFNESSKRAEVLANKVKAVGDLCFCFEQSSVIESLAKNALHLVVAMESVQSRSQAVVAQVEGAIRVSFDW